VASGLGGHGIGHHPAAGNPRDVDPSQIDRRPLRHRCDDGGQEAHVIDFLGRRERATDSGVPSVLRLHGDRVGGQHLGDSGAVGIDGEVPVLVGVGIHLRLELLQLSVLRVAVQVDHHRERLAGCGRRWDMDSVGPRQPVELQGEEVGATHRHQSGRRAPGGRGGCAGRCCGSRDGQRTAQRRQPHQPGDCTGSRPVGNCHGRISVPAAPRGGPKVCDRSCRGATVSLPRLLTRSYVGCLPLVTCSDAADPWDFPWDDLWGVVIVRCFLFAVLQNLLRLCRHLNLPK
jgi:hypothetical protein